MLDRWVSPYLYGVDHGDEDDAPVWIVHDSTSQGPNVAAAYAMLPPPDPAAPPRSRPRLPPTPYASFPVPGAVSVTFALSAGGNGIASLSSEAGKGVDTLTDDVA